MFPRRASTEARRKRSSGRPDLLPTPSMTVWFLPLEDLSAKISAPSTFGLNLILIKSTFAQSLYCSTSHQTVRQHSGAPKRPAPLKGD
jgi:hypothetical protein